MVGDGGTVASFAQLASSTFARLHSLCSAYSVFVDMALREELKAILTTAETPAEFEKYFTEFESVSKLQRLLDKDGNEVIKDFTNLIETNLRVDYNIKNSFQTGVPSRVHSF